MYLSSSNIKIPTCFLAVNLHISSEDSTLTMTKASLALTIPCPPPQHSSVTVNIIQIFRPTMNGPGGTPNPCNSVRECVRGQSFIY